MIAGAFGVAWAQWGASGLSGGLAGVVVVAGILVGLVIFGWSAVLGWSPGSARSPAPSAQRPRSMFTSRRYLQVVVLEVAAIAGGNAVLNVSGHGDYVISWIAAVVGVHFVAFGRMYWSGFYWLGAALIAAAAAGTIAGLAGGGVDGITATSGLITAASLFGAGGWTVGRAQAARPRLTTNHRGNDCE